MRAVSTLSLCLLLSGCPDLPEGRFACTEDSQCPSSWQCNTEENLCFSQPFVPFDAGAEGGEVLDPLRIEPLASTCALQGEGGTRVLALTGLTVPAKTDPVGFDFDRTTTTSDADVAGCRKVDSVDGIDNAFANIHASLAPTLSQANVNIAERLQASVDDGRTDLEVVVSDWNSFATDPCVAITIRGASSGAPISQLTGRAPMTNGRVDLVTFGSSLKVVAAFSISNEGGFGSCQTNCTTYLLPFVMQGVVARLEFTPDLSSFGNNSSLGGVVRYGGADGLAFAPGVTALFDAINMSLTPTLHSIFMYFLDLDTTPSLQLCEAVDEDETTADSFSVGFRVSGAVTN